MNIYYSSVSIAILANVGYHLCMKCTHPAVHPLASLAVSYGTAMVACLALLPLLSAGGLWGQFSHVNWASIGLGLCICLLELGFLLAYRAGWKISLAALFVNVAVGIALVPIGLWGFTERLSAANITGLILALAGLMLLGMR